MDKRGKNSPAGQISELNGQGFTGETVGKIRRLWTISKRPANTDELRKAIDGYFDFCSRENMRPGIEGMALALGTDRVSFWKWCQRDDEYGNLCRLARQSVITFLESANQEGKINPASAIFALKNWAGYQDSVTIETTARNDERRVLSASELPRLSANDLPLLGVGSEGATDET